MTTDAQERPLFPYGEVDPNEHPDWRAAREYGIDVTLLEANLRMTVEQRIEHLEAMDRFFCEIHGKAWGARWKAPATERQHTTALLELLADSGSRFVVIGGVAAISWRSAQLTRKLVVVMEFTSENLGRLLDTLGPHRPRHLSRPDLPAIAETPDELTRLGSLLLTSALGRLDVLREVPPLGTYAEVAARATKVLVHGRELSLIDLDDLIAIKQHVGRPKDILVATELKAVRSRIRGG